MNDATPARAPEGAPDPRHLELVEREVSRHRQNSLRVRMGALALVAGFIAVMSAQAQPRYMFLAPLIALAGWALDAHAEWNVRALRVLAHAIRGEVGPRPAPLSLDTAPWADRVSWRQVILRPARALLFHPMTAIAAYVSIDAPRLDPDGVPSELAWYLAVTFLAFLALVVIAWSWWYDHFGDAGVTQAPSFQGRAPAIDAPRQLRDGEGPFPTAPRNDRTRPFGTAVG